LLRQVGHKLEDAMKGGLFCEECDKAVKRRIGNEPTKRKMMSHGSNMCYESKRRNRSGMESRRAKGEDHDDRCILKVKKLRAR